MTPPDDCRCYVCETCYHDHAGWSHDWTTKNPCPGSTLPEGAEDRLWCVLRRNHPWGCVYGEDPVHPSNYARFIRVHLPATYTGSMYSDIGV